MDASIKLLPGQALSSVGRPRLDYRAVAALAFPFMLNSAVQAVLNATDTWFIGRLSPAATAGVGAVYWPILVCVLLFGGIGLSVQTSVAQAFGGRRYTRASQATWTAVWASLFTLLRQFKLGFPMGLLIAADILGFALFQLMQVRLGTVDGASTQIVMMLTSFCYMPAVGIAMAGTTLVGQAIGAHRRDWAFKVGNGIILMAVLYMGAIGVLLAAAGPWVLPFFTNLADPTAAAVVARGCELLWIAAGYQLFDGFNISSSACLRGAGDVRLPAVMVLALSWLLFVPLAHSLSFAPGTGWVDGLPQFGMGAVGGWFAALIYVCGLGLMLFLRWWSGAWQRIALPLT
jgi:MATE family multidrug resistance protein